MSPTAGSVPSLGMEDDKYETNDTVLDVPRDLFSIVASLDGEGPVNPVPSALGYVETLGSKPGVEHE